MERCAVTFLLNENERELLCHAVGWTRCGMKGARNHSCVSPGSREDGAWGAMVERGLARLARVPSELSGGSNVYAVTPEGCRLIGMTEAAIVRACGTPEQRQRQHQRYRSATERRRKRMSSVAMSRRFQPMASAEENTR